MPTRVISEGGVPVTVATMEDVTGGGAEVTSEHITDATTVGRKVLTAADEAAAADAIGAITGDQITVDGQPAQDIKTILQLLDRLILKSPNQSTANVIEGYFGANDGVLDVAIKMTATIDNKGQLALGVRDDSGNVVNVFTIDGNSKQIMVLAGYKLLVGASGTDISGITAFGKQLTECADAAAAKTLLGIS